MRTLPLLLALVCGCRQTMTSPAEVPERDATRAWGRLLARVVTDDGFVDYEQLEQDREALDGYVAWLASDDPFDGRKTRDHHALYLNAYNALVMFQVLERGRPDSVLDPKGWIPKGGSAFFYETQFEIGRDMLSLAEIEHERVRWKEMDFRDHAALNCASASCPPLRGELYRPNQLDTQLADQMERWVMDDERGVRLEDGRAVFNPIFDWYARDFAFFSAGLDPCSIAELYATGKKRRELKALAEQGCPHGFFDYDWSLNDATKRKGGT